MKKLVAVAVESDQHGTFYHNPQIITDYLSAVKYQTDVDSGTHDLYVEFVIYPEGTDLEKVVEDIDNYSELPSEWDDWLTLEDTIEYFEFEHSTYSDGSIAFIGDKVLVDSDKFSWGLIIQTDMKGTVTSLDNPYYIQLNLDDMNRQIKIPHYHVRKYIEDNNPESNNN